MVVHVPPTIQMSIPQSSMGGFKEECHSIILCGFLVKLMQREHVEAESITHNYYNSSMKPKFYKNTRLVGKIIDKTSLANFY